MNIYTRKNNNDLLKFMTQEEIASLPCQTHTHEYSPQELIEIKTGVVNIITRGIVNIISPSTRQNIMSLSEGEIFGEEKLFQTEWSLNYQCETHTLLLQYTIDFEKMTIDNKLQAKFNAALNDSLAEKLIRLNLYSARK